MVKMKRSMLAWLVFSVLSLTLAGFVGGVIQFHRYYQSLPSNHFIGNKESNVNALKEKGLPFSFLVIGDTQSSKRAEKLIELGLREGNPSFMVILGDFVKEPDIWDHRFFLKEMNTEIKPTFPVFLVPGNHDIDYTSSKIKKAERRVTTEIYESLYGARNFHFIYNNCLFIICGIDQNSANYLNYLRDTLSQKGVGKKYIFVFIHFPPKGLAEYIEGPLTNEEELFSPLEAFNVTGFFFGDYHGYWRGQRKGVNLTVSGGGGRLKPSQPHWGKFHHILRITVDENIIGEEMIVLPGEVSSFSGTLKKMTYIHLFPMIPMMKERRWALYLLFIFFLSWGIYSVRMLFHSIPKKEKT
jgi:hypothetical protein